MKQLYARNKWGFIAYAVKATTGILGGSLILTNEHPYLSLIVLSIGAIANEAINFFDLKK